MPEVPIAGLALEALGAASLAVILSSFQRKRPRAGVRDWSLGLWLLAAALLASIALIRVPAPRLRTAVLAVAVVLAYWSPALVLLGTWCRSTDRELPRLRWRLLVALFAITASLDALSARLRGDSGAAPLVAVMREPVQRLSGLMTDLLDYGRPIDAELTRCPVSSVAARAIGACADLARQADVTVDLRGAPADGAVLMDESRVLLVFRNLVGNAVEHTPRAGRVRVETREESRHGRAGVRCDVQDDGPGFAAADLPHLFEPFFSRRTGGTGLGLSIVRRIVEQHGGQVDAANYPDGGAVVSVWLPGEPSLTR